ncbi:hypothetical protein AB0N60_35955 [Streptomyces microflavus]
MQRRSGVTGAVSRSHRILAHPRSFEPAPADNGLDRDRDDDEEIDL